MLEKIKEWDTELFLYLNGLHHPALDTVMYLITSRFFWIPFYVVIVIFLFRQYRMQAFWVVIAIALTITLADQTASGLFKPYFMRLRPCYEASIQQLVHVVKGCGGQYGFVSSHAANTFALATFLFLLLRMSFSYIYLLFIWAILVSYSRIYMGVHYPLDLIGGAIIGIISALLIFYLYRLATKKIR